MKSVSDRRKILREERLCFNCRGTKHRAADCRSNRKCLIYKCKYLTSIFEKRSDETSEPILASTESNVIYPVTIINVKGIKCLALLDTGSGSSCASEVIIHLFTINPIRKEYKTIETLTNATTKKLKVYSAKTQDLKNEFSFSYLDLVLKKSQKFYTKLNKLEREVLLTLPNRKYNEIINKYNHLGGMHDSDTKKSVANSYYNGCK